MSPIFDGSSSNCLTRYKQILSGCSFVTIKLLNFTRLTMKTHDRGHASVHLLNYKAGFGYDSIRLHPPQQYLPLAVCQLLLFQRVLWLLLHGSIHTNSSFIIESRPKLNKKRCYEANSGSCLVHNRNGHCLPCSLACSRRSTLGPCMSARLLRWTEYS